MHYHTISSPVKPLFKSVSVFLSLNFSFITHNPLVHLLSFPSYRLILFSANPLISPASLVTIYSSTILNLYP
ncbi:uncharacterized protein B0P05DRAFT_556383 [Gilbertella persicaria]|uniref:uncharacterized protein n=1 Tax=Gilbertella persicaria TaxID=101096 RepID=UPI002221280E|nr:uncharacterized protein B0P05DRAFT_556383 [Gilbertella persicaria]KAI8062285.1 hypothetical protein B0P05DRAFT_556383 [Gilbertella persicaria]